ncbi:hypothetical protein QYE76_023966 [Lolium multiflorum]|uniref:UBX domain-containing protein n=1 Tax=Lolium multiflorum TaxID=4521 RepID=A0AAD8RFF9_LOLMU|nr:hypothetical protein QYE76_023966 [Lolium multiflorum]
MERGAREAMVDSFMEVTSCESQSTAVRYLASCGHRLEAAINRFFTVGAADAAPDHPVVDSIPVRSETTHDDTVRDPIPARSDRLYQHDDFYGPGSSTARAAPSIWSVNMEQPSRLPVYPVSVVVEDASMPERNATEWESDGDMCADEKEETNNIAEEDEPAKEVEEDYLRNDDKEDAMEEGDDTESMEMEDEDDGYEYDGTEADYEYSDDDQDDGDYLDAAETDHMEALDGQPQRRARADKTLDDLFRPPYEIMFQGSFHDAKVHAARKDQWLLINIQLRDVFASHLHNRDLWSNEVVAQVIKDSFVFSLLQKTGTPGDEAGKVCCFYKLQDDQLPAVLVLDPITGMLLAKWCGIVQQPNDFLTSIGKYTESKPSTMPKPRIVRPIATAAAHQEPVAKSVPAPAPKVDKIKAPAPLPNVVGKIEQAPVAPLPKAHKIEAPIDDGQPRDGETVCKLRVRFHTGSIVTKEFGSTRAVAVLFSYCRSVVRDQAGTDQTFRIMRMAGRTFQELHDDGASFEDLKLNRDTVMVVLEN